MSAKMVAMLDVSHKKPGDTEWTTEVATVEIPIAEPAGACGHTETICPDCAASWAEDHTFIDVKEDDQ